jgi:molybdopterin/thiamine biosynthesis adenylyltransferase
VALILGVGGLGTTIAMNCCRLGFEKIVRNMDQVINYLDFGGF